MRILHILENHEEDRADDYAAEIILGLQQAGIEQCAIIDRHSAHRTKLEQAGVKIIPLAARRPWRLSRRQWFRKTIDRLQPNVAHCWTGGMTQLLPESRMPVVGWLAGSDRPQRFVRCTHFVSANPEDTRQAADKNSPATPTHFIPHFSEVSNAPPFNRSMLATPHDAKVIVNLSPLHPASRLDILLMVLKDLSDCILWLAGEGPDRYALEEKARALGVLPNVRFTAPRLNRGALLRAADLCVLAAKDRPNGTLIPEAWAAGTPVIASILPGSVAPLGDGADGLLVPAGDEKALLETVRQALGNGGLRRRLVAKGYASYLGAYAREAVIRQWAEFYRQIAAGR